MGRRSAHSEFATTDVQFGGGSVSRTARIERVTAETKALIELDIDGSGMVDVETGIGFYDHMLHQFGKHAGFDLTIHTMGDLHVDVHHTVEDTAITLGQAFRQAIGDGIKTRRFAGALIPLDEILVQVAVDISGRPYLVHTEPSVMDTAVIGSSFPATLVRRFWQAFVHHAAITLHIEVRTGRDAHTIAGAQFTAVGRALRDAVAPGH